MIGSDQLVVLVDGRDSPVGVAPKLAAHRDGLLHRAVSVVLFDDVGRMLLQRRAAGKYHSALLWSNTCCGHPRPNESSHDAVRRRLREEMGVAICRLESAGWFVYRADASWPWCTVDDLVHDLAISPRSHTAWLPKLLAHLGVEVEAGPMHA